MHISEGILPLPVLAAGAVLTAGGTLLGLRKLEHEKIPLAGLMAASFFVASLIHVRLGPASVHLVLNGLAGLLLGWTAFAAILVALFLQAILFFFGGLTTLGVNTFIMAAPAVILGILLRPAICSRKGLSRPKAALTSALSFAVLGVLSAAVIMSWKDLVARTDYPRLNYMTLGIVAAACMTAGGVLGPFIRTNLKSLAAFTLGAGAVGVSAFLVAASLFLCGDDFRQPGRLIIASHIVIMIVEGIITVSCLAFLRKVRPEILDRGK